MIKHIFSSSSSAAFEWNNDLPYYSEREYVIRIDGDEAYKGNTNVFSIFDLAPGRSYTLTVDGIDFSLEFKTEQESAAINVRDFGAVGDGHHDDFLAVQTAINCIPKGGRLYFPEGTYLVSPLNLKSHITLDLAKGATILGTTDRSKYPVIPGVTRDVVTGDEHHFGTWEGCAVSMHQALICAEYAEDIKIVGEGTIDGNAQNSTWWIDVKKHPHGRPRIFFANRCENISLHGVTIQNSASWQLHPYFSKDLKFIDLKVFAPKDSPNTDALDPEACDNVEIIGCKFSVGDDCIAIKSAKIDIGRRFKTPASRHTIRNCLMEEGHGAITLGSEMAGGVVDLTVNKCVFNKTDRGLRIKTRRGRGKHAVIDGVLFENIVMKRVLTPIVINMWYNCCDPDRYTEYVWSREKLLVDERTPRLGAFEFRDMYCEACEVAACYCDGLPEAPIESIKLENITFTFAPDAKPGAPAMRNFMEMFCRGGMYFDNVRELTLKNVKVIGQDGDELIANNVEKLIKM